MKTVCLLHSLLNETQEWTAVIGPIRLRSSLPAIGSSSRVLAIVAL
jgi:hypothetical protein